MPEICSSSTPLLHRCLSETLLSWLLILACSCCPNLTLTNFLETERNIPDTSRSFPCTAWLLFPSLTTTAQRVYVNKTSTLGSIISYHNYFLFDGECVLPSPDTKSHWKRAHKHTHTHTFIQNIWQGCLNYVTKKPVATANSTSFILSLGTTDLRENSS